MIAAAVVVGLCNQLIFLPTKHGVMKNKMTYLVFLMVLCLGQVRAQTDPFFDVGQVRAYNGSLRYSPGVPDGMVRAVMQDLMRPDKAALVSEIRLRYGVPVWDQAQPKVTGGVAGAFIPLVGSNGRSITGVLMAYPEEGEMRYGFMDRERWQSEDPGMAAVLAHYLLFNDRLFGYVDCSLVEALQATVPLPLGRTLPEEKSCYFQLEVVESCWEIYGELGGERILLYTECSYTYNWRIFCNPFGGGTGGGWGDPFEGGGLGGGLGGGIGITDLEQCGSTQQHTCSIEQNTRLSSLWIGTCDLNVRLAGCQFEVCEVRTQASGVVGCGFNPGRIEYGGVDLPLNFELIVRVLHKHHGLLSVASYDPICRVSVRCGYANLVVEAVVVLLGIEITANRHNIALENPCYTCFNCPV
jgi:hypothetical protein